jgi:uncharacterized protein YukJ
MPLKSYGVLVARPVDRRREGTSDDTPHYQIHLVDEAGIGYRAAVNVKSQQHPSDLLHLASDDFQHPVTAGLAALGGGWHRLPSVPGGLGLDFIRGNLFDPSSMRPLPPELPGLDNDLADRLDHHVLRAIADPAARVYVYGERWGPEPASRDKIFGFSPGNGVHDVHMNQGSVGRFRADNGVWQDGALLIHFPADGRWVGIFLAFQSQAWHTDDRTGDALADTPPRPGRPGEEPVRIVAALVNPLGPAPETETVTLLNASPGAVDLTGWRLVDRLERTCPAPAVTLAPGTTVVARLADGLQLGNRGGAITLLDPQGIKVHGVSYTEAQANREGWTVVF